MQRSSLFPSTLVHALSPLVLVGVLGISSLKPTPEAQAFGKAPLVVEQFTAPPEAAGVNTYLIQGKKELVIVDGQMIVPMAKQVVERVKATGKTPKALILTHVHPDHFLGLAVLQEAFPGIPLYSTAGVKADYDASAQPTLTYMSQRLKDNAPAGIAKLEALPNAVFKLEGQEIRLEELKGGEHSVSALVHVPSANAIVTGDLLYKDSHLWMAECGGKEWQGQLETLKKNHPKATFYPGHGAGSGGTALIDFNLDYLKKFETTLAPISGTDAQAVADQAKQALLTAFPGVGGQGLVGMYMPMYLKCSGKVKAP